MIHTSTVRHTPKMYDKCWHILGIGTGVLDAGVSLYIQIIPGDYSQKLACSYIEGTTNQFTWSDQNDDYERECSVTFIVI